MQKPLLEALVEFHTCQQNPGAADRKERLDKALRDAKLAGELAAKHFPKPIDPAMGEVRAMLQRPKELAAAD